MKKIKTGDYTVVTKRNPRSIKLPDGGIILSWKEDKLGVLIRIMRPTQNPRHQGLFHWHGIFLTVSP